MFITLTDAAFQHIPELVFRVLAILAGGLASFPAKVGGEVELPLAFTAAFACKAL